jgi:hypothetical protein
MRMLAFALAAAFGCAGAAAAGGIDWIQNDYDKAVAQAKESGKLVLMNWHADW